MPNLPDPPARDRNLLFGVLAVQMKEVSPLELAAAAEKWAAQPGSDLGRTLLEMGCLSEEGRDLIELLLEKKLQAHAGDAHAAVEEFGGGRAIHESFAASLVVTDHGVQSSLASFGGNLGPSETNLIDSSENLTLEHPGRYKMLREHGRGGIGRIMVAQDTHLGREVALKELLTEAGCGGAPSGPSPRQLTAGARARFLREARITGQLEHPGIVPVYELARRADGTLYYAMKLVRGVTLHQKLKPAQHYDQRIQFLSHFLDICHAVAYAHVKGVIHRDLKPANVMVGEFGESVVLDWGLAKVTGLADPRADEIERGLKTIAELKTGDTLDGEAIGTPSYMSPEQAEGRVQAIDQRSDVWSLGAIFYEILTGRPPFIGDFPYEIIGKVIKDPVTPVRELEPEAPPELAAICEKCLRKNHLERFATAKELADEIIRAERAMVEEREREAKESLSESYLILGRWARSVKSWSKAEVYCAKALSVYPSLKSRLLLNELRMSASESNARLKLEGHQEKITALAFAPDGAFLASASASGHAKIWDHVSGQLLHSLLGHTQGITGMAFSLDGKNLATGSADKSVRLWDPVSGKLRRILIHAGAIYSLAFSPDSRWLAAGGADKTIKVWETSSGKLFSSLEGHGMRISFLKFAATKNLLASGSYDSTIILWDTSNWKPLQTLKWNTLPPTACVFSPDERLLVSSHRDSHLRVWDPETGRMIQALRAHRGEIFDVAFAPDGKLLASAGKDATLRLWDPLSGKLLATLPDHSADNNTINFLPRLNLMAALGKDGVVKFWEIPSVKLAHSLAFPNNLVHEILFSPDGNYLACANQDKSIRLWPLLPEIMHKAPEEILKEAEKRTRCKVVGMDVYEWNPQTGQVSEKPLPSALTKI